ncbi:MAG TPA: dTMP kinase [Thermoanaerobaculia bacterium]|nr:dTMP kinase [Thermoanaerobaculia bacterium]
MVDKCRSSYRIGAHCTVAAVPGRFITFEGLDGSGKSTQLRLAADWLREQGVDVVDTHEPGGTPLGGAVRGIFLDSRWGQMDGVVELLLVSASRRQHVLEVIEPALARGAWVLCDRFVDSSWAYQGSGRGIPAERVAMAESLATGGLLPELTLLFDLPAAAARKRGKSPKRAARGAVDRLDAEELAFYERVRRGFLDRAAADLGRFRIVDSSGDKDATKAAVRATLQPLLTAAATT